MGGESESQPAAQQNAGYSWQVGSVYVFNLMLGAGVLALPQAFVQVGWILGLVALGILSFFSYCTVTFVMETQSIHNALLLHNSKQGKRNKVGPDGKEAVELEKTVIQNNGVAAGEQNGDAGNPPAVAVVPNGHPIIENGHAVAPPETPAEKDEAPPDNTDTIPDDILFEITTKTELGELCKTFFNRIGSILYYISICLYLYGGLSIYSAAIAKSLTTVVCGDPKCFGGNDTANEPCLNVPSINVVHMYQIMLAAFVVLCCPFIFFTLTKTKPLQLFTMAFRWFALTAMIVLAVMRIVKGEGNSTPNLVVVGKLPNFFGVGLYSFMCQYSIPAVVTPVTNKKRLKFSMILDFVLVVCFFSTLLVTAVYAFQPDEVSDLYTLNFEHPIAFKYILELFPVFTLSANFPILGIVLRENLKTLFLTKGEAEYGVFLRRILFPLIVITPPIIIAFCTYKVGTLVGYTGAYAGAIIQYVIPAVLVLFARKKSFAVFGQCNTKYQSPFRHRIWVYLVLVWYVICFVFVTYYKATASHH